jgi:hypothetical protein
MKRILFAALGLATLTLPAMAGPRDDVLYGVSRCGGIADDRTWLDCVYGAAQPMRAKLGLPPAPASQQALVPPAVPGQAAPSMAAAAPPMINGRPMSAQDEKDFLDYQKLSVVPRSILKVFTPTEIQPEPPTTLKSYKFDAAGYFLVTLANGETWRQAPSDTTYARWTKPAGTYAAQIVPNSSSSGHALKVGTQLFQVDQVKATSARR